MFVAFVQLQDEYELRG